MRRELIKSFKYAGFQEVLEARNGKEGLELALSQQPDLIITDGEMPEMSGYEMVAKLKANERTKYIPVIIFSAGVLIEFVRKLVSTADLITRMKKYVQ